MVVAGQTRQESNRNESYQPTVHTYIHTFGFFPMNHISPQFLALLGPHVHPGHLGQVVVVGVTQLKLELVVEVASL